MKSYFSRSLAAHLRRSASLYLLTVFGVALGVASVLSIQIINRNAISAFRAGVEATSQGAGLVIEANTPSFPEEIFPRVLATEGVASAWPLVRADAAVSGSSIVLEVNGLDLSRPASIPFRADLKDSSGAAFSRLGWVAVSADLARRMKWEAGDRLTVASGSHQIQLLIGALIDFRKFFPQAGSRMAVMDVAQAQSLFGSVGRLQQINVEVVPGATTGEVRKRLEEELGPAYRVLTPTDEEQEAQSLMGAFRLNLTAMSLISLLVGVFLVHSSVQASLTRRRREFGLLRSLGATRAQVFGLIMAEVALLGMLGVAAGIPMGYLTARLNLSRVSATLTNLYLLQRIETLHFPAILYLLAVAVGVGGALAGAFLPAWDMSRRDSNSLMAAFTLHEKTVFLARPLALAGLLLMGATLTWYTIYSARFRFAGFVLGSAILISLPLFTPLLVRLLLTPLRVRRFGLSYSMRSLSERLQTTSFAVASLAIAVAMLVGITLMIGSFRSTVAVWISNSVRADVYISSPSWNRSGSEAGLDPALVRELARQPGVDQIDRLRRLITRFKGRPISVSGVDMDLAGGEVRFPLIAGSPVTVFPELRRGAVLIGEPLARKNGLQAGDRITLVTPMGRSRLPVAGVFYDYSSERGSIVMDRARMEKVFGPGPVNSVALYLRSGRDAEQMVDRLKRKFSRFPLRIRSNRDLRREVFRIFDQTFAVVRILEAMSLLIAVCGILLTLLVLARERISELALYRCLGARRRQIFKIYLGKGLGIGLLGLLLGTAAGVCLAWILIFVINRAYFGWTIQAHWFSPALLREGASILAAAVAASLYPALRASRTPATELTRDDL